MSVYGMLRTSVSGMAAQADRLGAIGDNIANVSTVGYKKAEVEFSSLVLEADVPGHTSGSVTSQVRHMISESGTLAYSTSPFDLAIEGNGFFVVSDPAGQTSLTRAGAFVPDGSGELVNSAGMRLLGMPITGGNTTVTVNGTAGLEPIVFDDSALSASPTVSGNLQVNVDATAPITVAGTLPSDNVAGSVPAATSSVVAYGDLGEEVIIDFHFAQTAAGSWEMSAFDNAARGVNGFPYSSGPLATATLSFDGSGELVATGATSITVPVPGGQAATFDLSGTTQLAARYSVVDIGADGAPASAVASVGIDGDGVMSVTLENGELVPLYRIPLATVVSPDRLRPGNGNTFQLTREAGGLQVGVAEAGSFGSIRSGALENSNVDLGEELTQMIESQRNYTANSKVFQTGSELIDVLVNLKR